MTTLLVYRKDLNNRTVCYVLAVFFFLSPRMGVQIGDSAIEYLVAPLLLDFTRTTVI